MATNQLANYSGSVREGLEALTPEQLDEQIAYFRGLQDNAPSEFGHWKAGVLLSTALNVKHDQLQYQPTDPA